MRRTKEEAELTRELLLKAALTVFSRKGYADAKLEEIAAEANVTRGALYHHFAGKAELYNTLVAQAALRIMPVIEEVMGRGGRSVELLQRLLVATLSFVVDDPVYRAVNELVLFKTEVSPELAAGMEMKQAGTRQFVEFLAGIIQSGMDAGELRPDLNARTTAIGLLSYQNGLILSWLLDPALFSLKDEAPMLVAQALQGIVVR